ncbi:MAG: Na+:solute symporter [Bacteroidia bacterium]|nr:Na+:solute symporter [Bacteroidia bacterium]
MELIWLDWTIIGLFFLVSLLIGIMVARKAGSSASEFFLSGRNMPWWLLGISMVATTFSADTPNLVTDIVRTNGVAGNWAWWAFLLTGMLTVFVYAKLWRRSEVVTDLEFYELRYSGKEAAFLRGFRAIYLGVFFNIMIMATVCLAAIKIGSTLLGLDAWVTVTLVGAVTVGYSSLGGLRGVLITDFVQFGLAMLGSVWATVVIVNMPEIQSLDALLSYPGIQDKLSILPDFSDWNALLTLLILPIAVQWWSVWYPGAEPGGGGYIAQRMLSAKNEKNAIGATLLFNATHYALRPWPWILIALASMVIYPMTIAPGDNQIALHEDAETVLQNVGQPEMEFLKQGILTWRQQAQANNDPAKAAQYDRLAEVISAHYSSPEIRSLAFLQTELSAGSDPAGGRDPLKTEELVYLHLANPNIELSKLGHDLAYPTMLRFLPPGLIGLILASLIAAVMSTLSTHLNWGSSYVVNDFYQRFVKKDASDSQLVAVGRISTVGLMVFSALFALVLSNALQAFGILLQIGAGTGLIFILRWFWWRINAWSEISAMAVSFLLAIYFSVLHPMLFGEPIDSSLALVSGVGITTLAWILVTLFTQPSDFSTLKNFYEKIQPAGKGWDGLKKMGMDRKDPVKETGIPGKLSLEILAMLVGCLAIYSTLFAMGYWIYGNATPAVVLTGIAALSSWVLFQLWKRMQVR